MTATMERRDLRSYGWATVRPVLDRLGVTYRQIDYWSRQGYIEVAGTHGGSGNRRRFTRDDIDRIAVIATLGSLGSGTNGLDGGLIAAVWDAMQFPAPRYWTTMYVTADAAGGWTITDHLPTGATVSVVVDVRAAIAPVNR